MLADARSPLVVGAILAQATALFIAYRVGKSRGRNEVEQVKRNRDREESWAAHREAQEREPPVDIGDRVTLGVSEMKTHHSGKNTAVGKKEGFVIFVEEVPRAVDVGDVVTAEVTSFGREKNSATATFAEMG